MTRLSPASLPTRLPWRRDCPLPQPDAAPTVRHPLCSRLYARQVDQADELGMRDHRRDLLAGLTGDVLEVGAGTGANLAHYPAEVGTLVATEPEPYLRGLLETAAEASPKDVRVLDAAAESLPFADDTFDAVVLCLVLCSVQDQERALAEVARVLRPGGELRFLEHVVSNRPFPARVQRTADRAGWPLISGGCHLGRDSVAAITTAGFTIERAERYDFRIPPLDPPKTHVTGVARLEG